MLHSLRRLVDSGGLDPRTKSMAIGAILSAGGSEDLTRYGLRKDTFVRDGEYAVELHARAVERMVTVARYREPEGDGEVPQLVNSLLASDHLTLKANALRLAGIWQVAEVEDQMLAIARDENQSDAVRSAAFDALVEIRSEDGCRLVERLAGDPSSLTIRSAAVQALTKIDPHSAAGHAADMFEIVAVPDVEIERVLRVFLSRDRGPESLAGILRTRRLPRESARRVLRSLFSAGRSDHILVSVLNEAIGTSSQTTQYSRELVQKLAKAAQAQGRQQHGASLFQSLACSSCHKVSGRGGNVGPDLTAIGTTLSTDRIIEELLWPARQIKEGYSVVAVVTDSGKVVTGIERRPGADQPVEVGDGDADLLAVGGHDAPVG